MLVKITWNTSKEIIYYLSNDAISNDFEWPLTVSSTIGNLSVASI